MEVQTQHAANEKELIGNPDCKDWVPKMEFNGFGKAYVPHQRICEIYSASKGLVRGTIFPELDIPYDPAWRLKIQDEEGAANDA